MAETYGILDPEALPVLLYAKLAAGLRETSRIKMNMGGHSEETYMISLVFDLLNARLSKEQPESLFETLYAGKKESKAEKNGRMVFDTPEAFEREYERKI